MLFAPFGKGRKRQKKGEKGRFRPISRKGGQTPLKPPFVTPPFAAAQNDEEKSFEKESSLVGRSEKVFRIRRFISKFLRASLLGSASKKGRAWEHGPGKPLCKLLKGTLHFRTLRAFGKGVSC